LIRCTLALLVLLLAPLGDSPCASDDALVGQLSRHTITVGEFTQERHIAELERPVESSGRFVYHADRGVFWVVESPVESRLVIDSAGIYQDGERVSGQGVLDTIRPLFGALFGGDRSALEQRFDVERSQGDGPWDIRLTPKGSAMARAIEAIEITGDARPRSVTIRATDGSRTSLTFDNIAHPQQLPPASRRAFDRAG